MPPLPHCLLHRHYRGKATDAANDLLWPLSSHDANGNYTRQQRKAAHLKTSAILSPAVAHSDGERKTTEKTSPTVQKERARREGRRRGASRRSTCGDSGRSTKSPKRKGAGPRDGPHTGTSVGDAAIIYVRHDISKARHPFQPTDTRCRPGTWTCPIAPCIVRSNCRLRFEEYRYWGIRIQRQACVKRDPARAHGCRVSRVTPSTPARLQDALCYREAVNGRNSEEENRREG